MLKYRIEKVIDLHDWDELVKETYGRPYSFQQQDGCRLRGTFRLEVPDEYAEDFDNESLPEEVNGKERGVKFEAWLARDPKQKLNSNNEWDREYGLSLFWERNFYPLINMVANDLHKRGLIETGEYVIDIDW